MKVEYNEETSVRKSLAFEIEPEVVDQEIESRAREYAKSARIPGFRKGKVPLDLIKRRFKAQVLEEVALGVADEAAARGEVAADQVYRRVVLALELHASLSPDCGPLLVRPAASSSSASRRKMPVARLGGRPLGWARVQRRSSGGSWNCGQS